MSTSPIPPVLDQDRYAVYQPTAATTDFALGFPLFGEAADVAVYLDGEQLALTTDYTVRSTANGASLTPAPVSDAYVRLNAAISSGRLEIYGNFRPRRTIQATAPYGTRDFNFAFSLLMAALREVWLKLTRALKVPVGEAELTIPSSEERAGQVLAFDLAGKPTSGGRYADLMASATAAVLAAQSAGQSATTATTAAGAAGDAATLADQLANAAPDTPVGTGFSARHWVAVAQALSDAFDLHSYSTTEQIEEMLESFVPTSRKIRVGSGLLLDGVAGSDAEPAEGDLSADRLLNLVSLSLDAWKAGTDATEAPISPEKLAATVAALAGGALPKGVVEISASGNYSPSQGTKFIMTILRGGGGSGAGANGSSNGGAGGGEGALGISLFAVNDTASYPVTIGAGGASRPSGNNGIAGGATSITVAGVTCSAGGGGGGTVSGSGGTGGSPSATCFLGYLGNNGSLTSYGISPWRLSGAYYGQGGGPSQAAGQSGSQVGGGGYAGHITIMEFGS